MQKSYFFSSFCPVILYPETKAVVDFVDSGIWLLSGLYQSDITISHGLFQLNNRKKLRKLYLKSAPSSYLNHYTTMYTIHFERTHTIAHPTNTHTHTQTHTHSQSVAERHQPGRDRRRWQPYAHDLAPLTSNVSMHKYTEQIAFVIKILSVGKKHTKERKISSVEIVRVRFDSSTET